MWYKFSEPFVVNLIQKTNVALRAMYSCVYVFTKDKVWACANMESKSQIIKGRRRKREKTCFA